MRHARITLTAGAIGGVALLTLTGCGSGGTPTDRSLSGETIEISGTWSGTEQEHFEQVIDLFEKQTGVTVEYNSHGDQAATALGTRIEGGSPPDLAVLGQPALLRQLAESGDLKPLPAEVLKSVEENYAQTWIDLATVDGEVYGVWFTANNKSTVWYNADIYDEAGASVPSDWDDFQDQLRLIRDSGYAGLSLGADIGWPLTDWFENVYLQTAGPEMYDKLAAHEIPWTDPSVTEALELLNDLWSEEGLVQEGAALRSYPESVTEVFGANPQAGTVYEGDFVVGNILDEGVATLGENALFYPFPSIDGADTAVVGSGDAVVAFNDSEATQAFLEFIATPEAAEVWAPLGGKSMVNSAVDTSLYPDDISRDIAVALTDAEVFRFDLSDLTPSAFGSTKGAGFWQIMIDFLGSGDVAATQTALEDAAVTAYAK